MIMAQGKFSTKNRKNAVDIYTVLAERELAQKHRSTPPVTTSKRKRHSLL